MNLFKQLLEYFKFKHLLISLLNLGKYIEAMLRSLKFNIIDN